MNMYLVSGEQSRDVLASHQCVRVQFPVKETGVLGESKQFRQATTHSGKGNSLDRRLHTRGKQTVSTGDYMSRLFAFPEYSSLFPLKTLTRMCHLEEFILSLSKLLRYRCNIKTI